MSTTRTESLFNDCMSYFEALLMEVLSAEPGPDGKPSFAASPKTAAGPVNAAARADSERFFAEHPAAAPCSTVPENADTPAFPQIPNADSLIVAITRPGEYFTVASLSEAMNERDDCFEHDDFDDLSDSGLLISAASENVTMLGGHEYLSGTLIIYAEDEDGELRSLTADELLSARRVLENCAVTIMLDGKAYPAIRVY